MEIQSEAGSYTCIGRDQLIRGNGVRLGRSGGGGGYWRLIVWGKLMRCDDKKDPLRCMHVCMEHLKFGSHYVIERMRQLKGAGKSKL